MKFLRFGATTALAGIVGLGLGAAPAPADEIADFYKNKRITVYVGSGAGGGYDTYARTMVRHMGRHIPGNPDFVVKNMDGAGSIVAANFVYNIAPQDGTVIGAVQRAAPLIQILGQKGPKFDSEKFQWLGSMNNEVGVLAVRKRTGVDSLEDMFEKTVFMASTGPNDTEAYPALLNNTLGTRFKMIAGYPSTPPAHLAMERGEVDGISQSWSSFKIHSGPGYEDKFNMLLQLSTKKHPELTKMGVPLVFEFIKPERLQPGFTVEEVETYFNLMLATKAMGRPYVLGPGVPADRVEALRKAFMDTATDPKFVADANRQNREVTPVSGSEIQEIVAKMAAAPKEVLAKLDDLIKYKGEVIKAEVEMVTHKGPVTQTKRGGRRIFIKLDDGKEVKAKISGSRTKVTINGKPDKRKNVKVGMTCSFYYPGPGMEAKKLDCEG